MNQLEAIVNALVEINPRNDWVTFLTLLDEKGLMIIQKPDPHLMEVATNIVEDRNRIRRELDKA